MPMSALQVQRHEFLIIIYGAQLSYADRTVLKRALAAAHPNLDLYEIYGGPDTYEYTFILE